MHKTLNLETWDQFLFYIPEWFKTYVFRGQADSIWKLKTSFDRAKFDRTLENERSLFSKFKSGSFNYDLSFRPEGMLEWLALMQHHGLPTRLLDFTTSPFIASYFAFEHYSSVEDLHQYSEKRVSIWAIEINTIKEQSRHYLPKKNFPQHFADMPKSFNFELYKFWGKKEADFVFNMNLEQFCFLCTPEFQNNRMINQKSVFLAVSRPDFFAYQQLSSMELEPNAIYKITLPITEAKKALRYLALMNINSETLFPSLDGLAKRIKTEKEIEFTNNVIYGIKFPNEYLSYSDLKHLEKETDF